MMFATLILEREPLRWADFPGLVGTWLQNAGGLAALALLIWVLAYSIQRPAGLSRGWSLTATLFVLLAVLSALSYVGLIGLLVTSPDNSPGMGPHFTVGDWLLALGGGFALAAVSLPVLVNLFGRVRLGRIWALARLSIKEALRSKVLLVFCAMALVFLFADWFVPYKKEDQVRNYVRVVYWSMTPLFLLTASLLGAFSIPTDVRKQSIHTIVTKPVERIEIVLGRFLGYGLLLTAGLFVLAAVSLLYVVRGVTPEAAKESYKARVPIYGDELGFYGTKGESVGREWEYRKYISGPSPQQPNAPRQYAVWSFETVPTNLGEEVPFEFTFDIFRLTKGVQNKGVFVTFTFADGSLSVPEIERQVDLLRREESQREADIRKQAAEKRKEGLSPQAVDDWSQEQRQKAKVELTDKFRVYQVAGVEVTDYHTQSLTIPATLFRILAETPSAQRQLPGGKALPALQVLMGLDYDPTGRNSQMLGVAKGDFYLLAREQPFWANFFKGVGGLWCTVLLVLGVAIAFSTYFSGVISWMSTLFLFGAGLFRDHVSRIAEGRSVGGGPLESVFRLASKTPQAAPLDDSPTSSLLMGGDAVYRWVLRRFLNILPDMNRFDLHQYVANGFDISWSQVLLLDNLLPLLAYLIPCFIFAFYLMKFREIANPT